MPDLLKNILVPGNFEPHSVHFVDIPWLMWADVAANVAIAVAYITIPIGLIYFLRRREDLAFNWMFGVFAAFIFACAVTHVLHTIIYFYGIYYWQMVADVATAVISLTAAALVWYVIPLALKIPNPQELARAREEARLREHELELQKKFELDRNEFISSVSHELRTPLMTQSLYIELLEKVAGKEQATGYREHLKNIREQAKKLKNLVDHLLDMIRSEGYAIATDFEEVDLSGVVGQVIEEQQLATKRHKIVVEGSVSKRVWADRVRVGNVLTNLIANAIKYSPNAGRIVVRLGEKNDEAYVSVQDFGIGIDKDNHRRIFDRFFRVAGSTQKIYPGMGVGLFLAAKIVREHGGEIRVESTLGKGSTFTFTIPFAAQRIQMLPPGRSGKP